MSDSTTTHTALDALASLASKRSTLSEDTAAITPHQTSSDDEKPPAPYADDTLTSTAGEPNVNDYESRLLLQELPSFPTRTTGRLRSASNPEGMEKWDSYSRSNDRRHFVLPSSILEEELASTRKVLGESEGSSKLSSHVCGFQFTNYSYYSKGKVQEFTMLTPGKNDEGGDVTTTNNYSTTAAIARRKRQIKQPSRFGDVQVVLGVNSNFMDNHPKSSSGKKSCKKKVKSNELDDDEVDESLLEPDELLKRARSKLLEDLSEENGEEEKGGLILPHSLSKYHEIYNKNGRIGIYTPSERAAIIAKFNAKRSRRVWNKKIRYSCRKNLADRRLRIKGRFVKRSADTVMEDKSNAPNEDDKNDDNSASNGKREGGALPTLDENESHLEDEIMSDVEDSPSTEEMPFRRTRGYTIS